MRMAQKLFDIIILLLGILLAILALFGGNLIGIGFLPQSFLDWRQNNMIELVIGLFLFYWAIYASRCYFKIRSELANIRDGKPIDKFYMMPSKAADYIMKHLKLNIEECNEWIEKMFSQKRLHIMARKVSPTSRPIFEPVELNLASHESFNIYLTPTNHERQTRETFEASLPENGWIEVIPQNRICSIPEYIDLRFNKKEIKYIVSWYKPMEKDNRSIDNEKS